jgi:hypothetical protein
VLFQVNDILRNNQRFLSSPQTWHVPQTPNEPKSRPDAQDQPCMRQPRSLTTSPVRHNDNEPRRSHSLSRTSSRFNEVMSAASKYRTRQLDPDGAINLTAASHPPHLPRDFPHSAFEYRQAPSVACSASSVRTSRCHDPCPAAGALLNGAQPVGLTSSQADRDIAAYHRQLQKLCSTSQKQEAALLRERHDADKLRSTLRETEAALADARAHAREAQREQVSSVKHKSNSRNTIN